MTTMSSNDNHIVVTLRAAEALRDRDKVSPADFHISATAYAVVIYLAASWPAGVRGTGTR
jgi:hypothetical protein